MNDLSAELAGELAAAGFAGMKDSTADFGRHEAYLEAAQEEIAAAKVAVESEGSTVAAVKRRVAEQLPG